MDIQRKTLFLFLFLSFCAGFLVYLVVHSTKSEPEPAPPAVSSFGVCKWYSKNTLVMNEVVCVSDEGQILEKVWERTDGVWYTYAGDFITKEQAMAAAERRLIKDNNGK